MLQPGGSNIHQMCGSQWMVNAFIFAIVHNANIGMIYHVMERDMGNNKHERWFNLNIGAPVGGGILTTPR